MKKKIPVLMAALILTAAMFCLSVSAFDANDYDYSSGGGGYSYSYSSDDFDGGGDLTSLLLAIVVVAIMCVYWTIKGKIEKHRNKKKSKMPTTPQQPVIQQTKVVPANNGEGISVPIPNRTVDIRDILRQSEPGFSEQTFLGDAVKYFSDIRGAICAKNVDMLRPVVTPEMLGYLGSQTRMLCDRHLTEHCDDLTVTNAYLTSLVRDGSNEFLTVCIGAQFARYLTDDTTGMIVEGSAGNICSYRWLMTFSRPTGDITGSTGECPHCGAPIVTGAEKCGYCGCPVGVNSREWLICNLDTVHDSTTDRGIRI